MHKKNIAIIGGGIGGIAATVALRRFGINAVVYEKSAHIREAGAGLMLWANAVRVLRELGLLAEILEQSGETNSFLVRTQNGKVLMKLATGGLDVPSVGIRRRNLLAILLTAVESRQIRLEHRFQFLEQTNDKVLCHFEGGIVTEHDAVIGADGINSQVRLNLFGDSALNYCGYKVWRGIASYDGNAVRPGTNSETWGSGNRFGILNTGHGELTWYATANFSRDHLDDSHRNKAELVKAFAGWHEPIQDLINSTADDSIMENNAFDHIRLPRWGQESVTLLGDAAHPCTPNLGQGGGLAIEDALVVAKCIAAETSLKSAFRRYESLRLRRTSHLQQRANLMGNIGQWENRLIVTGRNLVTKLLPAKIFEYNLRRIYSYKNLSRQ